MSIAWRDHVHRPCRNDKLSVAASNLVEEQAAMNRALVGATIAFVVVLTRVAARVGW